VENAVAMHVLDSLEQLIHVGFYASFGQIGGPPFYRFVQIHLHNLKNKSQSACRLIIQDFNQLDDVIMRAQPLKSLNFSKVLYL